MKFKVGDMVRCIRPDGAYAGILTYGVSHRVTRTHRFNGDDFVKLDGNPLEWFSWRFELCPRGGLVSPKNRSRVDAGPRWMG